MPNMNIIVVYLYLDDNLYTGKYYNLKHILYNKQ